MSTERRDHRRTQCQIPCAVEFGRTRIAGRVLDISQGGLCVWLPERLAPNTKVLISLEVPDIGPIDLETTVWHQRLVRQPASGERGWATGFVLEKADPAYQALVDPTSRSLESIPGLQDGEPEGESSMQEAADIYRVRVGAPNGTRTNVLTLSAASEEAAREVTVADLPGEWDVLDVEAR